MNNAGNPTNRKREKLCTQKLHVIVYSINVNYNVIISLINNNNSNNVNDNNSITSKCVKTFKYYI